MARGGSDPVSGSVTLVGDSLNVGLEPYLTAELQGWVIASHNLVGRRTDEGIEALRSLGGSIAPILVVSLGTNDVDDDVEAFSRRIDQVLELAGPTLVIWATIWLGGAHKGFNAVLREAALRHRSLELLDWAALVEAEPELLAADGVHGSADGYRRGGDGPHRPRLSPVLEGSRQLALANDPAENVVGDLRRERFVERCTTQQQAIEDSAMEGIDRDLQIRVASDLSALESALERR